jgi:hypothetical protein
MNSSSVLTCRPTCGPATHRAVSSSVPRQRMSFGGAKVLTNKHAAMAMLVRCQAEQTKTEQEEKQQSSSTKAKIYVGKGRFIEDDPSKYPGRTPLTGGFAGGEVGLKNFVASNPPAAKSAEEPSAKGKPSKSRGGIYVGKGRFVSDNPASNESKVMKKSGRDNSLVGGFAGGEVGLREFVETGEVPFDESGIGRRQQSPLIIAGIVSVAAVTGGILVTDVSDFGEQVISGSTKVSPAVLSGLDENTKLLLEAGVLMMGVVASVIGGKALIGSLRSSLKEGAARFAVLAAFWMVVFVAARFVLDSN